MAEKIEPRRRSSLAAVALVSAVALFPASQLLYWVGGFAVSRRLGGPILVLGGLAFALLVNVAASVRLRSERTAGAVRLECDVRIRYRGANSTVVIVAGSLAAMIALYLLAENFALS
jgi:hypothetical protein